MPSRPLQPCAELGCPALSDGPRCAAHVAQIQPTLRQSPSKRGYGRAWQKVKAQVLREEPMCQLQGCGAVATQVDHTVPLALGGTDDRENLVAMCHSCHSRKTATVDRGFGNRGKGTVTVTRQRNPQC